MKNYHIKKGKFFIFFNHKIKSKFLPDHGWKIHLSPYFEDKNLVLEITKKYLIEKEISFKFINSNKNFKIIYSDLTDFWNSCKFITIYCENRRIAIEILENLYEKLKNFSGVRINSDKPFKDSNILYYRYGNFIKKSNYDDNKKFFKLPEWEIDLQETKINSRSQSSDFFLNEKYKINKILLKKTSANVYLAKNKNKEKFVIKHCKKGTFGSGFESSIDLKKNEILIFENLQNKNNFSSFIEDFYLEKDFFTVWKYQEGINLENLFKNYSLLININDKKNKLKMQNFFNLFFLQLKNIIETNKKIYFNDLELRNFIYNKTNKKIYFVDLDNCFLKRPNKKVKVDFLKLAYEIFTGDIHLYKSKNINQFQKEKIAQIFFKIIKSKKFIEKFISKKIFSDEKKLTTIKKTKKYNFEKKDFYFKLINSIIFNNKSLPKKKEKIKNTEFWISDFFEIFWMDFEKSNFSNSHDYLINFYQKNSFSIKKYNSIANSKEMYKYFSPYFRDGLAGFIFLCLIFLKYSKDEEKHKKIKKIVLEICKKFKYSLSNKNTIENGNLCLILVIILAFKVIKDRKIISNIKNQIIFVNSFWKKDKLLSSYDFVHCKNKDYYYLDIIKKFITKEKII